MNIRLVITDEEGRRNSVPFLREEISLGRGEGNTIRLQERNVSRRHALLTRDGDEIYVEDLDSYNGVILNGNRIARRTHFFPGDILIIGDFRIELEVREDEALERVEINQESLLEARHVIEERCGDTRTDIVRMTDDAADDEEVRPEPGTEKVTAKSAPEAKTEPQQPQQAFESPVPPAPAKREITPHPRAAHPAVQKSAAGTAKTREAATKTTATATSPDTTPSAAKIEPGRQTPTRTAASYAVVEASAPQSGSDEEEYAVRRGGIVRVTAGIFAAATIFVAVYLLINGESDRKTNGTAIEPLKPIEVQQKQVNLDDLLPPEKETAQKEKGEAQNPETAAALEEARTLMAAMRWREAEKTLSSVLENAPDNKEASSLRMKAQAEYENSRNYSEGMKYFGKKNYLMAYMTLGQISESSLYLEKSARHRELAKTRLLNEYVQSGWKEFRNKKYKEAMSAAQNALKVDPAWTDALELKEQCEDALEKIQPAKQDDPYNAKQHYQIGAGYFQRKDYKEAINHFLTATRLDPEYALAYRAMGSSYALIGDMDKAMLAYRKYVKLAPDSPEAADVKKIIEDYQKKDRQ